jgi:hypothetical protein
MNVANNATAFPIAITTVSGPYLDAENVSAIVFR